MKGPATAAPTPARRSRLRRTSWCLTWSWTSRQSSRDRPRTGPNPLHRRGWFRQTLWHLCCCCLFWNQKKKIFKVLKGCVERSSCLVLNWTRLLNHLLPRLNSSTDFSPDKSGPSICTAFPPESVHEAHKRIYPEFRFIAAAGKVQHKSVLWNHSSMSPLVPM